MTADQTTPSRRRLRWLAVPVAIPVILLSVLWIERRPIAAHFVDKELVARGVPATYRITGIGPRTQRLENIVIGDPASPDFTADWAELHLSWGFNGPEVAAIVASGVRLHGRLIDGALRLGSIDKLLPAPTGAPFALPDLKVDLRDARLGLATAAGRIGVTINGKGNLARDFRGRMLLHAPRLATMGCGAVGLLVPVDVATGKDAIRIEGPVRLNHFQCGDAAAMAGLDGKAKLRIAGDLGRVDGDVSLLADTGRLASLTAKRWQFAGRITGDVAKGEGRLDGGIDFVEAAVSSDLRESLRGAGAALAGTPAAPLAPPLIAALLRSATDVDGTARLAAHYGKSTGISLSDVTLKGAASGARFTFGGGRGIGWSPDRGLSADGGLRIGGGGLPTISGRMAVANGVGEGRLTIAPYAADGARLALAPVQLVATNAGYAIDTVATMDGPLGDGAVRGLSLPVAARVDKDGGFALNPRCATLAFESLAVAGLVLAPARLPLCPTGRALLSKTDGGSMAGGAAIAGLKLAGRLSGSPLTMVSRSVRFDVGTPGFTANAVAVRLGQGDSVSRLDLARIAGRIDSKGLAGQFDGAAGKIAAVPLLLSEGQGDWRLAKGDLTLDATLRVADDAVDPRFNPLKADGVRLTLIDGKVHATGQLREPSTGVSVADLVIDHDLGRTTGRALLDVPGITFGRALQPEKLTRLTLGVVANVEGTVRGQGRIDWTDAGVTSGGVFRTDSLNLAAAFGPVTGLSGEIHFSDLLGLETPPGQEVRLAEVNPGVAVTEGVVRYQLLPGQQVRIEGGRWPFSGGELFMEPTTLDFVQPVARHMTFRVAGLDAALFIQRFEFDNIAGTGTFDGTLPIVFDDQGGRIENGRLVVRQGGGTLAYVGELSNEDLGTYGKMAFDALKAIRYDNLAIELNGNLDGEIVSQIVFAGVNEQPLGAGKLDGMAKELTGLPFKFNIVVRAPFRGLVSTATTFVDPTGLIRSQRAKDGEPPVQPHESEGKR